MIRNSEAEKLGFVQVESVTGVYLFKRTIPPAYAYSIEAFRGRYHLGSISVEGGSGANTVQNQLKSLKLQNNDTLIWVSLIPHQLDMDVPLVTKENNYPRCRLTIGLQVDPGRTRDFATLFHQCTSPNNDPVEMAKAPIANALQKYVRLRSYNELDNDEMQFRVRNSLLGDNKKYGLIVDSIPYLGIFPDEHITRQIQISQQAIMQRTQITEDSQTNQLRDRMDQERASRQNDFRRGEDARENMYQRQEQDLDDQRQRRRKFLEAASQTYQQGFTDRLQRDLNAGKSFSEFQEQNPEIMNMNALYGLPSTGQPTGQIGWRERPQLDSGSPAPMRPLLEQQPTESILENEDIPGLHSHKFLVFSLREPGITLLRVQLSDAQQQKANIRTQAAMLVCQINAADTEFAVGDIIISVEGIAVTDISIMTTILKEKHPATLSARLLRGDTVVDVSLPGMP